MIWRNRYTRFDLTLANLFTFARLVLIPIFGWLWLHGDGERALWIFAIAVATDVVDGFLARWLNQRSRLGALLDPIADKVLVLVALVVGMVLHHIPPWLAVVILGRDTLLAVGAVLFSTRWRERHGPAAWRPTPTASAFTSGSPIASARTAWRRWPTRPRARFRICPRGRSGACSASRSVSSGPTTRRAPRGRPRHRTRRARHAA